MVPVIMGKRIIDLQPEDIKTLVPEMGYSIVSNKVSVNGMKIGFFYREEPEEAEDSGWRFLSGTEKEDYVENPNNSKVFGINTVANFDRAIIPYLHLPPGTEMERVEGSDQFQAFEP